MSRSAGRRTALALVAVALSAACGSTVSGTGGLPAGALAPHDGLTPAAPGDQPTAGSTTGGAGGSDVTSGTGGAAGGGVGGATGSTAGTRPTASRAGGTGGTGAARPATGPVKVGILTVANGGDFLAAFGSNLSLGDGQAQAKAAVADVNSRGGLAGRRITPVIATFDATSSQPYASQLQAICASWTHDHHVLAAVAPTGLGIAPDDLAACLGKAGIPLVQSSFFASDAVDYARHPLFVNPAGFNISRLSEVYVGALQEQGFFTKGARVGLLRYDLPQTERALRDHLRPALARRGVELLEDARVAYPHSNADNGNAVAAIESAVLRFSSHDITRVLFLGPGAAYFFMQAAERQLYRPRYGITSYEEPTLLLVSTGVAPAQLQNTTGIGWFPVLDVDDARDPGNNPAASRCRTVMAAGGATISSRSQAATAFGYCDGLWALELAAGAAAHGSRSISGRDLVAALDRVGAGYRSPHVLATRLGDGRRDGASVVRRLRYSTGCSCFSYEGPTVHVP